ncbi:PREDICTED: uncharacterized protein LOC109332536 [Lupinus angustifolius]|uniref:uncharacterized protein LOC109332536 n=1 Tax=Lupinus angustifolius TaxID=3871 RepID=UPI00092E39D5|nr:PREDICTED: uncharacterized protein LOC109332536 [Lupinus angustifolius]
MSRIDRFLVNDGWLAKWGRMVQLGLPRTFLDHCPIMLKIGVSDWGPTPFRTNNCWLSDHRFGKQIEDKVEAINSLDAKGSTCSLSEGDVISRRSTTAELWRLSCQKDNLLLQKSRQRWIREGDSNSKFFHLCINKNQSFKKIIGLTIDGEWIEDPVRIKSHIRSFFEAKFDESHWGRPSLDGIDFNCLSEENNVFLTAKFKVDEIKDAVWSCDGDKSPGPDGYNFTFF